MSLLDCYRCVNGLTDWHYGMAGALRWIIRIRSDRRSVRRMPAALRRQAGQHYGVRVALSVTPENAEYARTLT